MPPRAGVRQISRREFIRVGGAAALAGVGMSVLARPAGGLTINPRSSWAVDRPPLGSLPPEDVRFLLVHHSASHNGHTAAGVPSILRSFYDFHTSPAKGWNDIAYNFLIDAYGGVWEGRAGSIAGAVAGDATGGNQGFSQLVCVIGDYNAVSPTAASLSSLTSLLAWLADKHGVATSPGSSVGFVSKGSNLWPAGVTVTTPTITGHRTMSKTTCPGDNLYAVVAGSLTASVDAVRSGAPAPTTAPPPTVTTSTVAAQATTTTGPAETSTSTLAITTTGADPVPTAGPSTVPPTAGSSAVTATVLIPSSTSPTVAVAAAAAEENTGAATMVRSPLLFTGAGLGLAATAGLVWRLRRMRR